MLDCVLTFLEAGDIGDLRLTASAFRDHPAVLSFSTTTSLGCGLCDHELQTALTFLRGLPHLRHLWLYSLRTLDGMQQLTQLCDLTIFGVPTVLDLQPLGRLPQLTSLWLTDCPADRLHNLSGLSLSLISLRISGGSLHHQVSSLTALRVLKIADDVERHEADVLHCSLYSGLTGLSSLCDDISGSKVWPAMPSLRALEVLPGLISARGLAAVTHLQTLHLDMTESAFNFDSLAPLSALVHLERLYLCGQPLPIPALASLTRLTLQIPSPSRCLFPAAAGLPSLRELHLDPDGVMHLPDLAVQFPRLSRLVFSDCGLTCHVGRVSINMLEAHRFKVEHHSYLLPIDQDDYGSEDEGYSGCVANED